MKFLVIGASGFIGSHILRETQHSGREGIGTRAKSKQPGLRQFDLSQQSIADCIEPSFWRGGEPIAAIVCSSISQIDRCFREREASRAVNVRGTIRLLDELAELGARLTFLSSSHAFDGANGNYSEVDDVCPISEYGRQKVEVEQHLNRAHPTALTLRMDKVVGADPTENHLFREWLDWSEEGRPFRCIAQQRLSPTLVNDVAKSVIRANQLGLNGVYHVANDESFTRAELAALFLKLGKVSGEIVELPADEFGFADARPLRTNLNGARFCAETGISFTSMNSVIGDLLGQAGSH